MNQKGFTLVELLLVVALVFIVSLFTFPIGLSFLYAQTLDETTYGLTGTLRAAQSHARHGKADSAFGVKILSNSYVLFAGDSYALRDQTFDTTYSLPASVAVEGFDEVVFEQSTGYPDVMGVLSLSLYGKTAVVVLDAYGLVGK